MRPEDTGFEPHLQADLLHPRAAPEALGAVAHDPAQQLVIGDHQLLRAPEAHAKQRPELIGPALHVEMDAPGAHLQAVAQQRPAARTGQVLDAAKAWRGHRQRW